ncbi:glutathione peroxidase, partial [Haematococcus lacustris]
MTATDIDGVVHHLSEWAGQVMLIVNLASKCGYTDSNYKEIKSFCTSTYDVTFPLFSKVDVNGPNAHPLFKNFSKFLVDKDGKVVKRFDQMWTTSVMETEALYEYTEDALFQPLNSGVTLRLLASWEGPEPAVQHSAHWTRLTHALSGVMCTALSLAADPAQAVSMGPAGPWEAVLPQEPVCTDNLTPWLKLLPCGSKAGVAQLMSSRATIFSSCRCVKVE